MATSLTSVLRGKQKCPETLHNLYRRCFASKRRKTHQDGQKDKVHVKSLFEAQKVGGKPGRGGAAGSSSYRAMLDQRREQAARSVLIRVSMAPQDVCHSLQAMGPISSAFSLHSVKNYLLVEFQHQDTVEKLMDHVSYFPDAGQVPVRSRLLYAMQSFQMQHHRPGKSVVPQVVSSKDMTKEEYIAAESVSDQMKALHDVRRLSDVGSRLRFLVCSLVEDLVGTSMPFCHIEPFGSCSNGFGWDGGDLDMMMKLTPPASQINSTRRFRFLTKRGSEDDRVFGQQCLDVVGEMIRGLMPSAHSIHKVLNARVPIVKFHHEATTLDCDLSSINLSGTKMSELMYLLGEVDPCVRILMTTIKQWARSCDLTRSHPGPWPANFTLLTMLIFFLQTRSPPLLPALRHLQHLAGPDDHFIIDDVDYAFVTDVSKVAKSTNMQSLEELLQEFFHFFAHFDFSSEGLSLIEGSTFPKLIPSPMHIENPLDIGHNVSHNVNPTFLTRMQEDMVAAIQCLESKGAPAGASPWGLLCLFEANSRSQASKAYSVAGLFEEESAQHEQLNGELNGELGGEGENKSRRDSENLVQDSNSSKPVETENLMQTSVSKNEKGSAMFSKRL